MLENNLYNLTQQMTIENKSLWRIRNMYKKDAEGCPECLKFWKALEKDKEEHVKELRELLKKHL
ncbi:MAG TPA: hypothetical protein VJ574_01800 [Candidatus Bathyarchaeia archaeon]|nr:hypothetical protein [Candidatus Bathyarchaeia archaeon]